MLLNIDLLHEGILAQHKFGRREFLDFAIPGGRGHGADQNPVRIRHGGHNVIGQVVLNLKSVLAAYLRSYSSVQSCVPLTASISCTLTRMDEPLLRMLPSIT